MQTKYNKQARHPLSPEAVQWRNKTINCTWTINCTYNLTDMTMKTLTNDACHVQDKLWQGVRWHGEWHVVVNWTHDNNWHIATVLWHANIEVGGSCSIKFGGQCTITAIEGVNACKSITWSIHAIRRCDVCNHHVHTNREWYSRYIRCHPHTEALNNATTCVFFTTHSK